jgi:L-ribulose-5-phosphate 4-epimerase
MTIDDLKEQVCEANRALDSLGLVTLTWGNVSGIDRTRNIMVIKPSGVAYKDLKPSDMVVLDFPSGKNVEGKYRPSSDTPTHIVLYQSFPEIGGVTHTHSTFAVMFAQACRPVPALGTTHADHFYGEVPLTRALTEKEVKEAYEVNTGKVIAERFQGLNSAAIPGVLVANHGPFTWGPTPGDSLNNSVALEAVAKMAFGTYQLNQGVSPMPAYLLDKHYFRKHGPGAYYGQKKKR